MEGTGPEGRIIGSLIFGDGAMELNTYHTVDVIGTLGVLDHVLIVTSKFVGESAVGSTSALQALHCRDIALFVGRTEVTPIGFR